MNPAKSAGDGASSRKNETPSYKRLRWGNLSVQRYMPSIDIGWSSSSRVRLIDVTVLRELESSVQSRSSESVVECDNLHQQRDTVASSQTTTRLEHRLQDTTTISSSCSRWKGSIAISMWRRCWSWPKMC